MTGGLTQAEKNNFCKTREVVDLVRGSAPESQDVLQDVVSRHESETQTG